MDIKLTMSNVQLNEIFIEVRFKDNFKLPDKKYKILDKITEYLPEYKKDHQVDELHCRDIKKGIIISIFLNRIVVHLNKRMSSETTFDVFKKTAFRGIKEVVDILKIDSFKRVGVRSFWSYNVHSLEEAANIITNNHLSFSNKKWMDLGVRPSHCQLVIGIGFYNGQIKNNLILAPEVEIKGEIHEHFTTEQRTYLKIDWDYYTEMSMGVNDISRFIEDAYLSVEKKVLPFLSKGE